MFQIRNYFKMFRTSVYFVLLFGVVICKLPDFLQVCNKSDLNFNECLWGNVNRTIKHLATNGEPMYKLPNISNIYLDRLAMHATPELKVDLRNLSLIGLADVEIQDLQLSDDKLFIKGYLPVFMFVGDFDFLGKILMLVLNSQGAMNVTQFGVNFEYKAKLLTEDRHGKKYYYVGGNPDETQTNITNIKNNYFYFDNLFPGDPRIGAEMNIFLNENWRDVYNEVQAAMEFAYTNYLFNPIINGFFRHIPIESLFEE